MDSNNVLEINMSKLNDIICNLVFFFLTLFHANSLNKNLMFQIMCISFYILSIIIYYILFSYKVIKL